MTASDHAEPIRLLLCAAFALLTAPGIALLYGATSTHEERRWATLLSIAGIPVLAFQGLCFGYAPDAAFGLSRNVAACAIMVTGFIGRLSFKGYAALLLSWSAVVYDPIAYWACSSDGWLSRLGVVDFAGALPIHLS